MGIRLVFAKQIALFQRRYSKTGFMKDFTDGKVRSASDFPDEAVVRLTASHKTKQVDQYCRIIYGLIRKRFFTRVPVLKNMAQTRHLLLFTFILFSIQL